VEVDREQKRGVVGSAEQAIARAARTPHNADELQFTLKEVRTMALKSGEAFEAPTRRARRARG